MSHHLMSTTRSIGIAKTDHPIILPVVTSPSVFTTLKHAITGNDAKKCKNTVTQSVNVSLGFNTSRQHLELSAHEHPIHINDMFGRALGFGLDHDRCINGTFLDTITIKHDTYVMFSIIGHAGAPDPKIRVDLIIKMTKDGHIETHTLINNIMDPNPKFNATGTSSKSDITLGQLSTTLINLLKLPEKGFNANYKPEQKYVYVLDEIIVDSISRQNKSHDSVVTGHPTATSPHVGVPSVAVQPVPTSAVIAVPTTVSPTAPTTATVPVSTTKLEHFRIANGMSFDDTNNTGDFHIYLLLLILFILIVVYLYKTNQN